MAKVKVRALVPFSSAHAGSRAAGEQFSYDVEADPAKLIAEGKVEPVKAKAEASKAGDEK